jgi:uncharacterized membrane protein
LLTSPHALALAGAFCSAVATILLRQGLRGSNFYAGYWINVAVGVAGLWGAVLLWVPSDDYQLSAVPFFVVSGLVGTAAGRFLRVVSIEKVGASVSAAITNLNPFIAAALAIAILGERVTLPILAGTLVIVLGTVLLSLSGRAVGFRPVHLLYPFLSASCFGLVAIIRKLGLSQMGPLLGSAINMASALVASTAYLLVSGNLGAVLCDRRSLLYFVGAGIAENAGVFLVLAALRLGSVSVVTPLSGTAPLFVLPLAFFFLKGMERLTWRVVVGSTLIVLGVFLLTA